MKKIFYSFHLIFLFSTSLHASHLVGGELNYKKLNGFNYEISLTLYRDCAIGNAPFDTLANFRVFDSNNRLLQIHRLKFTSAAKIGQSNQCIDQYVNVCYQVTTYIDTFFFPAIPGGYQLSYQVCCRNSTISNIISPALTGTTYYANIPDVSIVSNNSNPVFSSRTPTFICIGVPFTFNHSAIDLDGDSLVYELFHPYGNAQFGPLPATHPPYLGVNWENSYSTNNMLGSTMPLTIDSKTGILTVTPDNLGQFVVGISVSEYRNGIFLGKTIRDYQFNVIRCDLITVAAFQPFNVSCGDSIVHFTNSSLGQIDKFLWDFGDATTDADTSNLRSPSYTYKKEGIYNVQLIVYSENQLICNDTMNKFVTVLPNFTIDYSIEDSCSSEVFFEASSSFDELGEATYLWDFGDESQSNMPTTSHNYNQDDTYNIRLFVKTPNGCSDSISHEFKFNSSEQFSVPNIFTPNNDGINDVLSIQSKTISLELDIYNRWGKKIFQSNNVENQWDGTYNGENLSSGVYFYKISNSCGATEEGYVTLVR